MKYIEVKAKKSGQVITILEQEFNENLFEKLGAEPKEVKQSIETKEEKKAAKRTTKARVISSESFHENKD
jgi:hypothetical protein